MVSTMAVLHHLHSRNSIVSFPHSYVSNVRILTKYPYSAADSADRVGTYPFKGRRDRASNSLNIAQANPFVAVCNRPVNEVR